MYENRLVIGRHFFQKQIKTQKVSLFAPFLGSGVTCEAWSLPSAVFPAKLVLRESGGAGICSASHCGKLTPAGKPDPSVFSTERNREGIRVGTAIGLLVRVGAGLALPKEGAASSAPTKTVRFRNFWGVNKRADLLASLETGKFEEHYERVQPSENNRYSFRAQTVSGDYLSWPKLVSLCAISPFNGPIERRANSLIVFQAEETKLALLKD